MAGVAIAAAMVHFGKREEPTSFANKVAAEYHEQDLGPSARSAFDQLTVLTPDVISGLSLNSPEAKLAFGAVLQDDVSLVSSKLAAAHDSAPERPVDEYRLAHALIPKDGQEALLSIGITLIPVPMSYRSALPKPFITKQAGHEQAIGVPLASSRLIGNEEARFI